MSTFLRSIFALAALLLFAFRPAAGGSIDPANWDAVMAQAKGQTVYWNAWGGEPRINQFIAWAGEQMKARFGVTLVHVKLSDTAESVTRVLAEKTAGNADKGAVDLIWINGENFAAMKRNGLLFGPWAEALPNFALTNPLGNPAVRHDFTLPVEGYEAPWTKAQLVFYADSAKLTEPPRSIGALLEWAKGNPGRFAYPRPPDFMGSTFLKQALLQLAVNRAPLYRPATSDSFATVTAPLWAFVDQLNPLLWRKGEAFPNNSAELRRLAADGEIEIGFSFDPAEVSAAIASGEFRASMRTFVLEGGTIGNVSFLAIPFNASNKAGAMVLANFLLSPEAQARMQDPDIWGALTVLAVDKLPSADKARFDALDLGVATLKPAELGPPVPEPHPSWMELIEKDWAKRYTKN